MVGRCEEEEALLVRWLNREGCKVCSGGGRWWLLFG